MSALTPILEWWFGFTLHSGGVRTYWTALIMSPGKRIHAELPKREMKGQRWQQKGCSTSLPTCTLGEQRRHMLTNAQTHRADTHPESLVEEEMQALRFWDVLRLPGEKKWFEIIFPNSIKLQTKITKDLICWQWSCPGRWTVLRKDTWLCPPKLCQITVWHQIPPIVLSLYSQHSLFLPLPARWPQ